MIIFPAVDIKDGMCVRLVQGRKEDQTVYSKDPAQMARQWQSEGAEWVHVVDLDGAFSGVPKNTEIIKNIASTLSVPFQLGGGIRDIETARSYLSLGVSRIILGTRAQEDPTFVENLVSEFGPEKIIVGIDAKNGFVAVKGWEDTTGTKAIDLAQEMKKIGVVRTIYTDVSRDGLLQGPNHQAIGDMAKQSGLAVIASGGVSTVEDIVRLRAIDGVEGAIMGKALYDGKITLEVALLAARN
ncbi:MAG: 1-(5-phosphoribosyl)-5-[(5-phosphoribosylamino)methylideneamino]imidazole-4-carboxamide isomerase [Candidatus Saccharibacteria bacterium]